jgi:hypothetical protein
MVVSDVRINNRTLNLRLLDAETTTHTGVFRADVWLLPFLNVYGLVGETAGNTRPAVAFPNGRVLESTVDYNRFSYGGGVTVAGGWKSMFLTLDANWTTGPIVSTEKGQVGDEPIRSFTFTPRFGILMSSGRFGTGSIWVGGMCLIASSEIHDKIDFSPRPILARLIGQESVSYSVQVKPKDKWNLLIGGNWEITKRWSLTAEVGGVMDRFPDLKIISGHGNWPWAAQMIHVCYRRPNIWRIGDELAGLDPAQYAWCVIRHDEDDGKVHFHVIAVRIELLHVDAHLHGMATRPLPLGRQRDRAQR